MSRSSLMSRLTSRRLYRAAPFLAGLVVLSFLASGLAPLGAAFGGNHSAPSHSVAAHSFLATTTHAATLRHSGVPLGYRAVPIVNQHGVLTALPPSPLLGATVSGPNSRFASAIHPNGGPSTNSNYYVGGSDCSLGASITSVGPSNLSLVAANVNYLSAYNGTGGTPCNVVSPTNFILAHGVDTTYTSSDGGVTWTPWYLGQATNWTTLGNPTYNSTFWGSPALAAGANNVAIVGGVYSPPCYFLGTCAIGTAPYLAPWGLAASTSIDGGITWSTPAQISAINAIVGYFYPSSCTGGASTTVYGAGNLSENPSVAYDAADHTSVLTWDVAHYIFNATISCTQLLLQDFTVDYSYSSNNGATWSTPKALQAGGGDEVPSVSFGPAPNHNVTIITDDLSNPNASQSTTTGNIQFTFAQFLSSDKGHTFGPAADLGTLIANLVFGSATPDAFGVFTIPSLTYDNWTGSPYAGSKYLVWADNQSGTYGGYPAIDFMAKGATSIAWSSPTTITTLTKNTVYEEPTVAVGPNGNIWVVYYGVDHTLGSVRVYGVVSQNGGSSWSPQFVISDADSIPGSTIRAIGPNLGVTVTTAGAFAAWTDCRSSQCVSAALEETYTAHVHVISVTANVPGVIATLTTFGTQAQIALPAVVGWDSLSNHTISVPQWFPGANSSYVETFSGYSGVVTSSNYVAGFTYTSGTALSVSYVATPAGWIAGTFSPIANTASLKINGNVVPLTKVTGMPYYSFNYTVAAGQTYTVNATAAPYYTAKLNQQEPVAAHSTTWYNISLPKTTGTISGVISPANVTVKINSTSVTPGAGGTFNQVEPWGFYWVNATSPGLTSFSSYVQVNPATTTPVSISLSGGWVNGTVTNAGPKLAVSLDGLAVPTNVGTFSVQVTGGFHVIAATQPGYNLTVIPNLKVIAGQTTIVTITLTNQGTIQGQVAPALAVPVAVLHIYNATTGKGGFEHINTNGSFAVQFGAGTYNVNVTATGYTSFQTSVVVSPGNLSGFVQATLVKIQTCVTNCGPPTCQQQNNCPTTGNNATPSSGLSTTAIIAIAAILGIVVIAALVLLTRRGRGGGGSGGQEPDAAPLEDQTYQGGTMAELPHLQSDGTMDAGTMPPPPPPQ
ncbi:MAG: hypothetical protein L3K19_09245 [Thermoplasmata archaeon]|nr:hypothetical protein [Thermoplasmata archaeon]